MRQILQTLLLAGGILSYLLLLPLPTWAAGRFGNFEQGLPGLTKSIDEFVAQDNPFLTFMAVVVNYATGGVILIGLVSLIIGGYLYMTAGGDGGKVSSGKQWMTNALVAIFLALTAWAILTLISPQFTSELKEPVISTPAP